MKKGTDKRLKHLTPETLEVAYVATGELVATRLEVKALKEQYNVVLRQLNQVIDDILFLTNGRKSTVRNHHDMARYNEWAIYDDESRLHNQNSEVNL